MALTKSPLNNVMASVARTINSLQNEKNPKYHLTSYETLTQLVVKNSLKSEICDESLHSIAIPIALHDITTGSDNLVLAALSFLGGLLQVVKLPIEKQILVIEALTTKLSKVSEKNQSRKLMWSLANVQFDNQLSESVLAKMLHAACIFLADRPPVISLSTVCESLNTLKNMGVRHKEYFQKNLVTVLPAVSPWLFNEADRIRELSLVCLEPFTDEIAEQKLFDTSFQNKLRNKYYSILNQLVSVESGDSLRIWSFLIQAFGTELHDSVALLNELLKIEESALKSKNPAFRQRALEHWRFIIDCFALNPAVLNNSKRIKLVLVPLKSTDTRTVDFSKTKIELWWHLLERLGADAVSRFQEVTSPLLTFCFGSQEENTTTKGITLVFPNIVPLATTVLEGILSPETQFNASHVEDIALSRSHPFLGSEDFNSAVDNFSRLSLFTLSLKSSYDSEAYVAIIRSFIERCCVSKLIEPLKGFLRSLWTTATTKPGLMEIVFDALTAKFTYSCLLEILTEDIEHYLNWFVENEPLSAHPINRFLVKLFEAGVCWNVAQFTLAVLKYFDEQMSKLEQVSNFNNTAMAELWSKLANALIEHNESVSFPDVPQQVLLLPLTWHRKSTDNNVLHPWSILLSVWSRSDPSVIGVILNPRGLEEVDVEDCNFRPVLSAVHSELSSYFFEISSWIKRWGASWIKLANVAENRSKCTDMFVTFLTIIVEELKTDGNAELLLLEVKTFLQSITLTKEISEILNGVFGPVSCSLKTPNVQKFRAHTGVCKLFLPLVTRNTPARNKQKPKALDDFVIVPPPTEKKRVLTEHQKEVMRSKRRASCVPALYNDLSQSSQTDSMDTQSSDNPVETTKPLVTIIDKEEDALMEPPIVLKQLEVLSELPDKGNLVDQAETNQVNKVDDLMKGDMKLRSKVCVRMSKLPTKRRSLRQTSPHSDNSPSTPDSESSLITEEDEIIFQRPCPASKKARFPSKTQALRKPRASVTSESDSFTIKTTEAKEPTPDKNHDKENDSMDHQSVSTRASAISSCSPPNKEAKLIEVEDSVSPTNIPTDSLDTEISMEVSVEQSDTEPQGIEKVLQENAISDGSNIVKEQLTHESDEKDECVSARVIDSSEEKTIEACASSRKEIPEQLVENIMVESRTSAVNEPCEVDLTEEAKISTSLPSVEVDSTNIEEVNSDIITETSELIENSQTETPALENNASGIPGDTTPSEIHQQKMPIVAYKNLIKNLGLRTKKIGAIHKTGPTPSTGKRGAQILELSRKIQNEPPSKKSRKAESPQKETPEVVTTVSMGELVVTPEGSPARTALWLPRTYSPYASPSTGILKKRIVVEESEEIGEGSFSPASSASKGRRVSFADPEVSHSVKISPVKKRLSRARTRRSLIATYENSLVSEESIDQGGNESETPSESVNEVPQVSALLEESASSEEVNSLKDRILCSSEADKVPTSVDLNKSITLSTEDCEATSCNKENQLGVELSPDTKIQHRSESSIFPSAVTCSDPLASIVDRVTSPASRKPIMAVLEKLEVRTIGDFCALSEESIQGLNFQLPQHETIKQFLGRYFAKKVCVAKSSADGQDVGIIINESPSSEELIPEPTIIQSSGEAKSDDLVSLSANVKTEELDKSLDSLPDGQVLVDSPEVCSANDEISYDIINKSSTPVCDTVDVIMGSDLADETNKSSPFDDLLKLSGDEVVRVIESHPSKDEILSIIFKKYISISVLVNGKECPIPNSS